MSAELRVSQLASSGVGCVLPPALPELKRYALVHSERFHMSNSEHVKLISQGAKSWNQWRDENPFVVPDLSGSEMNGHVFWDEDEGSFNLNDSNLSKTWLIGATFAAAKLKNANLEGAFLVGADFSPRVSGSSSGYTQSGYANLASANLRETYLNFADFTFAEIGNVDFTRACMGRTNLGNNDLRTVVGLDSVYHQEPSTIGLDTIYRSKAGVLRSLSPLSEVASIKHVCCGFSLWVHHWSFGC
jgi:hypothetical protein